MTGKRREIAWTAMTDGKRCPGPTFCVTAACGYVSIHERSI
jgi:hypothetical protein